MSNAHIIHINFSKCAHKSVSAMDAALYVLPGYIKTMVLTKPDCINAQFSSAADATNAIDILLETDNRLKVERANSPAPLPLGDPRMPCPVITFHLSSNVIAMRDVYAMIKRRLPPAREDRDEIKFEAKSFRIGEARDLFLVSFTSDRDAERALVALRASTNFNAEFAREEGSDSDDSSSRSSSPTQAVPSGWSSQGGSSPSISPVPGSPSSSSSMDTRSFRGASGSSAGVLRSRTPDPRQRSRSPPHKASSGSGSGSVSESSWKVPGSPHSSASDAAVPSNWSASGSSPEPESASSSLTAMLAAMLPKPGFDHRGYFEAVPKNAWWFVGYVSWCAKELGFGCINRGQVESQWHSALSELVKHDAGAAKEASALLASFEADRQQAQVVSFWQAVELEQAASMSRMQAAAAKAEADAEKQRSVLDAFRQVAKQDSIIREQMTNQLFAQLPNGGRPDGNGAAGAV